MKQKKCQEIQNKAIEIIPGMTQLLSKRPDKFAKGLWPTYFSEAHGIKVTDLDNNEYLDFSLGGIGATVLGYADEDVNNAVIDVIRKGNASTLNGAEEVALAEKLIELHPWANMARFARGGGEAMSIAVRIARVATGKDNIVFCGYHGWCDWYLAANLGKKNALDDHWIAGLNPNGVPTGLKNTTIPFKFNDTNDFLSAISKAGNSLAAIVMEPIRNYAPNADFIKTIEDTAKQYKVPLIIDEITAGFRICNGGAHLKLGIHPDMAVFSKALGNGFCSSAIIGKKWVMSYAQDAFITSTNWTERIGAVAALAMINKYIKNDVSTHLKEIATAVSEIWKKTADKYGLKINIGGFIPLIHFTFEENHAERIAYFTQEMLKLGFLAGSGFYPMFAHTNNDVIKYEKAFNIVFEKLKMVVDSNELHDKLECEPVSPGFARIN